MSLVRDIRVTLTIVGDTGSGKTCLARRMEKPFQGMLHVPPTIGAEYFKMTYPSKNYRFQYSVWDTAGQVRYRTMLPMYTKDASVLLFCFDVSAVSPEAFDKQLAVLTEIQNSAPSKLNSVESLLVFTKNDSENQITDEQIKKVKEALKIDEFVRLSAKTGVEIDLLSSKIAELVEKQLPQQLSEPLALSPSPSSPITLSPKQAIARAIKAVTLGAVLKDAATANEGQKYLAWLQRLEKSIDSYKPRDRRKIAEYVLNLSLLVAKKSTDLKTAIHEFHFDTQALNLNSKQGEIIGGLIGAAFGVLLGSLAGAKIGAAIGASVGGTAAVWCTHWYKRHNDPILNLELSANRVVKAIP